MSSGISCFVTCNKYRLTEEKLSDKDKSRGAEDGDFATTHVVSFGTNTAHGGYERLCITEATLRKIKQDVHTDQNSGVICCDAGSGLRAMQYVLVL